MEIGLQFHPCSDFDVSETILEILMKRLKRFLGREMRVRPHVERWKWQRLVYWVLAAFLDSTIKGGSAKFASKGSLWHSPF